MAKAPVIVRQNLPGRPTSITNDDRATKEDEGSKDEGSQDPPSFRLNSQPHKHYDLTNSTKISSSNHAHGFIPLNRRNWSLLSSQSSSTASSTAPSSTSTVFTAATTSRQHLDSQRIRSKYLYKLSVLPPLSPITTKNNVQRLELLKRDLGQADLYLCTSSNLPLQVSSKKDNSKLRLRRRSKSASSHHMSILRNEV